MLSAWLVVATSAIASAIHVVGSTVAVTAAALAKSHVHLKSVTHVQSLVRKSVLQDAPSLSANHAASSLAASLPVKSVAAAHANLNVNNFRL